MLQDITCTSSEERGVFLYNRRKYGLIDALRRRTSFPSISNRMIICATLEARFFHGRLDLQARMAASVPHAQPAPRPRRRLTLPGPQLLRFRRFAPSALRGRPRSAREARQALGRQPAPTASRATPCTGWCASSATKAWPAWSHGKRGPQGPSKITPEILRFVDEQRARRGRVGSTVLVREIKARFGVSIHRVSLDQALARRAKKNSRRGAV